MLVWLARDMWLGCALQVLCGDAQRQSKDTATLAGSCVAQSRGAENSCAMGRRFSHRRTIQKEDNLLGTALLRGTCCQALPVSRSMANDLLQIKGPVGSADAACETRRALGSKGRHRTEATCDMDVKHSSDTVTAGWWQGAAEACCPALWPLTCSGCQWGPSHRRAGWPGAPPCPGNSQAHTLERGSAL